MAPAEGGLGGDKSPGRRGPRPVGSDTRSHIVGAAVEVFTATGYDKGSARSIAKRAGVDPALIRHYFASKTELFVEAMRPPVDLGKQARLLADGDPDLVGERLMRFFVSVWDDPVQGPRIVSLMRSALIHPEVAGVVQRIIIEGVAQRVAAQVGAPDPKVAAAMAATQVMGLAMMRHVAKLDPLASMPAEELVARYGPVLTRLIRGLD